MSTYQYSFASVDLWFKNFNAEEISSIPDKFKITGFGTGEGLINVQRRAPIATTQFGAYGDMVISMQRILAADLTFPVLMNAPENAWLQTWCNHFQSKAGDKMGAGNLVSPFDVHLVDNMGNDTCVLNNGVILAVPAMVRGQTMNVVTWVCSFEKAVFTRAHGLDSVSA